MKSERWVFARQYVAGVEECTVRREEQRAQRVHCKPSPQWLRRIGQRGSEQKSFLTRELLTVEVISTANKKLFRHKWLPLSDE